MNPVLAAVLRIVANICFDAANRALREAGREEMTPEMRGRFSQFVWEGVTAHKQELDDAISKVGRGMFEEH